MMSDELDQWLEELAGRRPADPLTQSLRDHLLGEAALQTPQRDELAYRRLLQRLDKAGLLNVSASSRRTTKPAWVAFAATLVMAVGIAFVQPSDKLSPLVEEAMEAPRGTVADRHESPISSAGDDGTDHGAAAAPSQRGPAEMPKYSLQAAPPAAFDSVMEKSQAMPEGERLLPSSQGRQAKRVVKNICRDQQAVMEIAVANSGVMLQFYSALSQIDGASFRYRTEEQFSDIRWQGTAAAETIAGEIHSLGAGDCSLPDEGQLKLRFIPGGGRD